jgi:hypothetical protein
MSARQEQRVPFEIHNAGTRRLVLNEVDVDCGCGDPIRKTVIVPPGRSVDLTVTLNTRFVTGPIQKIASFATSDPARPRFDLTVRAWVDAAEQAACYGTDEPDEVSVLISRDP